jgi:hypothetical protein
MGPRLPRRSVVGKQHHDGVLGGAGIVELVEYPADLGVGVAEEPGIDLHHPGVKPALVSREPAPSGHMV